MNVYSIKGRDIFIHSRVVSTKPITLFWRVSLIDKKETVKKFQFISTLIALFSLVFAILFFSSELNIFHIVFLMIVFIGLILSSFSLVYSIRNR